VDIEENANVDSQETDIQNNDGGASEKTSGDTVDYAAQYKELQTEFLKRNESNKALTEQVGSMSQKLEEYSSQAEILSKLKSALIPEEQEDQFSWQKVPDILQQEKAERARLAEENKALAARLGNVETAYQSQMRQKEISAFNEKYESQFSTKEDFQKAIDRIGETVPNASELYMSGTRSLDSLFAEMLGAEMANPDSGLIKSMEKAAAERALKKSGNHISSGEYSSGGSDNSGFDSVITSVPLDF